MCYIVLCKRRHALDIQLKRGLLDSCVLAAIRSKDSYGYQIIKDVSPFLEISESTLYPILGRLRKYYHITDAGLKRIDEFLRDWHAIQGIYEFIARDDRA